MTNETRQPKGIPTGGQFAEHARDDATIELRADERAVHAEFVAEKWDTNDYAIEVDRYDIDVRAALDAMSLEDVQAIAAGHADADFVYEQTAQYRMLSSERYDGPYTLRLDTADVAEYIEQRQATGQIDPVAAITYSPARSAEVVHDTLRKEVFSQLRFSDLDQLSNFDAEGRLLGAAQVVEKLRARSELDLSDLGPKTEQAMDRIQWLVRTDRGSRSEAIEVSARLADALIDTDD